MKWALAMEVDGDLTKKTVCGEGWLTLYEVFRRTCLPTAEPESKA
jgi:hypothetical protein